MLKKRDCEKRYCVYMHAGAFFFFFEEIVKSATVYTCMEVFFWFFFGRDCEKRYSVYMYVGAICALGV